jgi:hypothetical protein
MAYNLTYYNDINSNKEGCSSASVSIAPIPSSILSAESHYNQTYTGIISGAGSASDSSPATLTSMPSSQTAQTTGPAAKTTKHDGIISVVTVYGGSQGSSTAAPTSNNGDSGGVPSGTGDAQGRNSGVIMIFSFIAFAMSVLYLI